MTYNQALSKDPCMAVGYFQRGYVNFKLGRYEKALSDCHLALAQLRNNSVIDYKQLGLRHLLYAWEILYNTAAALCHLGRWDSAQETLIKAIRFLPNETKSGKLDSALEQVQRHDLLQPLHVPNGEFFRPRKQEVEQLDAKDFLGKPKVISSVVPNDQFSGFEPLRPQKPGFYEPCREAMPGRDAGYHRVLVHYYPETTGGVTVKANNILYVLNKDGDWATAIHDGQKILIPTSFLEPVNAPKADITKMNNGIPLPPAKMPPARPNVKPAGNAVPASNVPPRPAGNPPEVRREEPVLDIEDSSREHHVVDSSFSIREDRFANVTVHPRPAEETQSCRPHHLVDTTTSSIPEIVVMMRDFPQSPPLRIENVVSLQSSPQTKQVTKDRRDLICRTEPEREEDNIITLQVHTEFTVDLTVRKDITYSKLQNLLREKMKQQGEQMNLQLSYRDSEAKQVTPVREDEDLKGLWEKVKNKKLMLCCKDMGKCVGRTILYHVKAIHQYPAEGPEDLAFNQDDFIDILSEVNEEWLEGHCHGSIGIFPKCFVTRLSE
ncbi:NADPH oxidase activator 1 isoform X2 [Hyperolius riggenbachi]|uniref:NADPH oxidase activator 1 isoform X2 n=1 Tax=Hyperolius riggenbachi TaxID=752182 RepID=UPI0035A30806